MLLQASIFAIALVSGFAAYRLAGSRRARTRPGPALVRTATLLAWFWLALSALLFAWAAARMLG